MKEKLILENIAKNKFRENIFNYTGVYFEVDDLELMINVLEELRSMRLERWLDN